MKKLKNDSLVILHKESRIGPKLEEDLEFSFGHVHIEVLWGYRAVEINNGLQGSGIQIDILGCKYKLIY